MAGRRNKGRSIGEKKRGAKKQFHVCNIVRALSRKKIKKNDKK